MKKVLIIIRKIIVCISTPIVICGLILFIKGRINQEVTPDIFGYRAYIILTGSMSPVINAGDIILTKETNNDNLKIGDIITYRKEDYTITHRIVKIINNSEYITKGDSNNIADPDSVKYADIEGKEIFKISKIGILLYNKLFLILVAIIILIIFIIPI